MKNVGNGTTVYSSSLGQSLVLSEEEFATLTTIDNPNLNLQAQQIVSRMNLILDTDNITSRNESNLLVAESIKCFSIYGI